MRFIFSKLFFSTLFVLSLAAAVFLFIYYNPLAPIDTPTETYIIENTDITEFVTASAKVNAKKITRLAFPTSGVIQNIYKEEGETAQEGEIIASQTSDVLVAQYNAALEDVKYLEQEKKRLLRGPENEVRNVARTKVLVAEAELQKVIEEYDQAIANARRLLMTTGLTAYPVNVEINDDIPPTISGNYNCSTKGEYRIDVYASDAISGHSYRVSGLATGTYAANVTNPEPLGDCGLYIQFAEDERYRSSGWVIPVPNTRHSQHTALQNNIDLLIIEREKAIKSAEESVTLAETQEAEINAPAAIEDVAQVQANLDQAIKNLLVQEALTSDKTIRSPFNGIVSKVNMKVGESAGSAHTVTIINEGEFDLVARIPEIDIKKVSIGDKAHVTFDADKDVEYVGTISFVSPVSIDIGGASYYEAYVDLADEPDWLLEGLNADIEILTEEISSVTAVPERFLIVEGDETYVLVEHSDQTKRAAVEIGARAGGMAQILNLKSGTKVHLP